jgi:hypothetical protein
LRDVLRRMSRMPNEPAQATVPLISVTYNRSYLFHGGNTGSNPVGDANIAKNL